VSGKKIERILEKGSMMSKSVIFNSVTVRYMRRSEAVLNEWAGRSRRSEGDGLWDLDDIKPSSYLEPAGDDIRYVTTELDDLLATVGVRGLSNSITFRKHFGMWPWDFIESLGDHRGFGEGVNEKLEKMYKLADGSRSVSGERILNFALEAMTGELGGAGPVSFVADIMSVVRGQLKRELASEQNKTLALQEMNKVLREEIAELKAPSEAREMEKKKLKLEIQRLQERKWLAEKRVGKKAQRR